MKIKHVWSVLCHRPIIDSNTNNISLLDAFEQINISFNQRPAPESEKLMFPYNFSLVSLWAKGTQESKDDRDEQINFRLQILDPQNKILDQQEFSVPFGKNIHRMRNVLSLQHIPITTAGIYWFVVKTKNEKTNEYEISAELPLEVRLQIGIEKTKK